MVDWFINLSEVWQIAIFTGAIPVGIAGVTGLFALYKYCRRKKTDSSTDQKTIRQEGKEHTAANIDGDKNITAGGNVSTGIDSEAALTALVETSAKLGRSEAEKEHLRQTVEELEEQLAKPSLETNIASEQSTPVPSAEAKDLAAQIDDDDAPYVQALKAIAEGDHEKAGSLLDETQEFLDTVQQAKDAAQAKIYMGRMQNASYAGSPRMPCNIAIN